MQGLNGSTFMMAGFYTGSAMFSGATRGPLMHGGAASAPVSEGNDMLPDSGGAFVASSGNEADSFSRIGVYSSAPSGGRVGGRRISQNDRLKVFLTSDYPLGLSQDEIASDSAERIKQLAFELHNLGHKVVVMAPSYQPFPDITSRAPFPIRHLLFTPGDGRLSDFGRAAFGFDVPALNQNSCLESDCLIRHMTEENVDRLVMGYLAMMRFTALTFGEPNVVITSHATSLWNYAASRYPRFSMVSASDVVFEDMHPKLQKLIRLGASSVHMFLALSDLETRRLGDIVPKAQLVKRLPFDVSLFGARSETGKRELLARYGEKLAGISDKAKWVMLHDRSGHPDVLKYFVKVGAQLERDHPDVAAIIVSAQGNPKHVTREIEDRQLRRVRLVQPTKRGEIELLLSNGDATIIFNESGELPRSEHQMGRELWIASRLAVILNGQDEGLSTMYFPGRIYKEQAGVRGYFGRYITDAVEDFEWRSRDLDESARQKVLDELNKMKRNASWVNLLQDELGDARRMRRGGRRGRIRRFSNTTLSEDTPRTRAIRQLRYSVRRNVTADIASIAYTGFVPTSVAREKTGVDDSTIQREIKRQRRWSLMTYLEGFLFAAANEGTVGEGGLDYRPGPHRHLRGERLKAIKFNPEVREAFDDVVHDLERERSVGDSFRRWQRKALGAVYKSSFLHPADVGALPNPRSNQNAVLSEIARLSGVSTKSLQEYLQLVLEQTTPDERVETNMLIGIQKAAIHACDCGRYGPLPDQDDENGDDGTSTPPPSNVVSLLNRALVSGDGE